MMQDMIYHTQMVSRSSQQAFIIADLPFMSSATSLQAAENAAQLIQQGGAQMVKLEGAKIEAIEFMVQQSIPPITGIVSCSLICCANVAGIHSTMSICAPACSTLTASALPLCPLWEICMPVIYN
jgi:hypothetical protein